MQNKRAICLRTLNASIEFRQNFDTSVVWFKQTTFRAISSSVTTEIECIENSVFRKLAKMTVTLPNILITGELIGFRSEICHKLLTKSNRFIGTPGVGKSRICAEIAKKFSMKWQDVSKIAKDNGFVEEYDETLECPVLDEDKVNVHLKTIAFKKCS